MKSFHNHLAVDHPASFDELTDMLQSMETVSLSISIQQVSTIGFAFMDATASTSALTGVGTELQICRAAFTRVLRA